VGDGGDELVLEGIEFGALAKLEGVLLVLLACEGQLLRQIARGFLGTQEGEEEYAGGGKQREKTK
jgi:hypothetical protein